MLVLFMPEHSKPGKLTPASCKLSVGQHNVIEHEFHMALEMKED